MVINKYGSSISYYKISLTWAFLGKYSRYTYFALKSIFLSHPVPSVYEYIMVSMIMVLSSLKHYIISHFSVNLYLKISTYSTEPAKLTES